jgi:hypothetical protein
MMSDTRFRGGELPVLDAAIGEATSLAGTSAESGTTVEELPGLTAAIVSDQTWAYVSASCKFKK